VQPVRDLNSFHGSALAAMRRFFVRTEIEPMLRRSSNRKPFRPWLAAMTFFAATTAAHAQEGAPVHRIEELWPALTRCWRPPAAAESSEVTVVFSLTRDGEILGEPAISHSKLTGDEDTQRAFVRSVLAALAQCTPAKITQELGGVIAGQPISMRFGARTRQPSS
jgi:hypothetical protein